jgi:hypothetical protein
MDTAMASELAAYQTKPQAGSRITLLPRGGFVVSTTTGRSSINNLIDYEDWVQI